MNTPTYADSGLLSQFFLVTSAGANDANRISRVKSYIKKFEAVPTPTFNAFRLHIAPSELTLESITRDLLVSAFNFGGYALVADSVNAVYFSDENKKDPTLYPRYINRLRNFTNLYAIDDANRFTDAQIKAMARPIRKNGGTCVISGGQSSAERLSKLAGRKPWLVHELQAYRHGESTVWPSKWLNDENYNVGCWAFEFYKEARMTTPVEVAMMWNHVSRTPDKGGVPELPGWIAVYGAADKYDLLSAVYAKNWDAMVDVLEQWWRIQEKEN